MQDWLHAWTPCFESLGMVYLNTFRVLRSPRWGHEFVSGKRIRRVIRYCCAATFLFDLQRFLKIWIFHTFGSAKFSRLFENSSRRGWRFVSKNMAPLKRRNGRRVLWKIFKIRMESLAFEMWASIQKFPLLFLLSKQYIYIYFAICVLRYQIKWKLLCIYIYITFSIIVIWNCGTKYDSTLEIEIKT